MSAGTPYIVLAAGGTGGHMMPAEAVAGVLKNKGCKVSLITDKRGDAIGNALAGFDRFVLDATSHMAGGLVGKLKALVSIGKSTLQVRKRFKAERPDVVVGFGGYPSLPAVLAARSLRIPYVLHEQNAVLGRVNRHMAEHAAAVALSVTYTQRVPEWVHTVVTGNPVRQMIAKLANLAYAVPLGAGDIRVFILGGSQGARILSDVVPAALAAFGNDCRHRFDVIHQARPEDLERVTEAYKAAGIRARVQPYFDDVGSVLTRSQLVICRAGASTLAELTAMGRPAILVPLAIAADDHQRANAEAVVAARAGWMMEEKAFTVEALHEKLETLFSDMGALRDASENMRTLARLNAADELAALVISISKKEGKA
ncbi:undecaprenyldiphospho-muramoylpentapeptide beta-N-acetylglucosaminyltransferase [Kordiimonas marina]|uniref:undecaprenyldiphospho-muramoylpentapeptide beta-N-acetylglucosaminyltransferase n=1 Tax=Kordiimonas marina TaxID=2872312 RepID=UPI001FF50ABD|nr:undecaprenyldiphospho-muramoylpentapeptide beta-N-acetylglucosaminyltransferase [Kordiimonas marina]MCJ9429473.1 undecaprenyldiphospho-muramoylpentapeptide beta-N-acetylglucosaminyltransferase [Kordiimonas marina]